MRHVMYTVQTMTSMLIHTPEIARICIRILACVCVNEYGSSHDEYVKCVLTHTPEIARICIRILAYVCVNEYGRNHVLSVY